MTLVEIPELLGSYIPNNWVDNQAKLPLHQRSLIGLALTDPRFGKAIEPLLRWIKALETVIERNPSIPISRTRIGSELTSTNRRNVMAIAAELDELAFLLPRSRNLRYYQGLPRPDFEVDLAGRDIFIEVTTLRESKESEAEENLREELAFHMSLVPSGCLVTVDYGRGSFDRTMRGFLETELRERLKEPPSSDVEGSEVRIRDRGKALHRIRISIHPKKAPTNATVVVHGNFKDYRTKRGLQIRSALKEKRSKFVHGGPNVLVLDGTIDYYPFQLSNILRGQLQWQLIPIPEKGLLVPTGLARGRHPLLKFHPELAAVIFKPHTRPLPERLVFANDYLDSTGLPLSSEEVSNLGTPADDYGY